MAVTLPHTFVAGQVADATELNAQFDVLYDFINTTAVHKDGTVRFTSNPSLPSNPTTGNQMTRMGYSLLSPKIEVNTALTDYIYHPGGAIVDPADANTFQWAFECGWANVSLVNGLGTITLTTGFANAITVAFANICEANVAGSAYRTQVDAPDATHLTIQQGTTTRSDLFTYLAIGY